MLIRARTLVVFFVAMLIAASNAVASSTWPRIEGARFTGHSGIQALEAVQPSPDLDQQHMVGWSMGLSILSHPRASFTEILTSVEPSSTDRAAAPSTILGHIEVANNPVLPFAQARNAAQRASYALTLESLVQQGIALPMSDELVQPRQLDTQRFATTEFSMGFFIPGTGSMSIFAMGSLLLSNRRRIG